MCVYIYIYIYIYIYGPCSSDIVLMFSLLPRSITLMNGRYYHALDDGQQYPFYAAVQRAKQYVPLSGRVL